MWKSRAYKAAGAIIDSFGSRRKEFLDLVAEAVKESASWEPTDFRRRQIEAWGAAYAQTGRTKNRFDPFAEPTLQQVKAEFVRLFPKAKLPADSTFRQTFRELGLPLAKDKGGRPKGSPDSYKRKRKWRSTLKV